MHKFIYKLNIITGMALIPLDITADSHLIDKDSGMILFKEYARYTDGSYVISYFPINNTIIRSYDANPDYIQKENRGE